jgi:di/tricarboxylate transporter
MQVIEDEYMKLLPEVLEAAEDGEELLPTEFSPQEHAWNPTTPSAPSTDSNSESGDGDEDRRSANAEAAPEEGAAEEGADEEGADEESVITEVVLLSRPRARRENTTSNFERENDVVVLAVRRGNEVIRQRLREVELQVGDVLLVQANDETVRRLHADRNIVVSGESHWEEFDRSKIPLGIGIVAGVVGLAAVDVLPIVVSALAGVVAMFFTGILRPTDAYEAVDWDVIFLLAGVIPLGIAFEASGTADVLAAGIMASSGLLPAIALLGVFYLGTALITEIVSNAASVVLMLPIAVEVATRLDANAFAFALAVTFAASTPCSRPSGTRPT